MSSYRVGFGFDVHRFSGEKKDLILQRRSASTLSKPRALGRGKPGGLILGGVRIPYPLSLEAVSDGDVILHAISDALCGAASLGDIGDYFPPEDKRVQGISSTKIAETILGKLNGKYTVENIDVTVIAEEPPLSGYKQGIIASLKNIFKVSDINLKIKSKENLNILGGVDSIACMATVLLEKG